MKKNELIKNLVEKYPEHFSTKKNSLYILTRSAFVTMEKHFPKMLTGIIRDMANDRLKAYNPSMTFGLPLNDIYHDCYVEIKTTAKPENFNHEMILAVQRVIDRNIRHELHLTRKKDGFFANCVSPDIELEGGEQGYLWDYDNSDSGEGMKIPYMVKTDEQAIRNIRFKNFKETLSPVEEMTLAWYEYFNYNATKAGKILGVSHTTIDNRIKALRKRWDTI